MRGFRPHRRAESTFHTLNINKSGGDTIQRKSAAEKRAARALHAQDIDASRPSLNKSACTTIHTKRQASPVLRKEPHVLYTRKI